MAKECRSCGKTKPTTEFSKSTASKDGLQYACKACNKKSNKKFREDIQPDYQTAWYERCMDKWTEYMNAYRKADKGGKIYSITAPDGKVYIGMTEMHLGVRKIEHKRHYQRALKGKRERLPLLHNSFDKHGYKNHKWKIIKECPGCDRKQIHAIESAFIQLYKVQNISLNYKR